MHRERVFQNNLANRSWYDFNTMDLFFLPASSGFDLVAAASALPQPEHK